jgi:hypothetical protein
VHRQASVPTMVGTYARALGSGVEVCRRA